MNKKNEKRLKDAEKYFKHGQDLLKNKDYTKAIEMYTAAALLDYTPAQQILGEIYYSGKIERKNKKDEKDDLIITPNPEKAAEWKYAAAMKGTEEERLRLAKCFLEDKAYLYSPEKAFKLLSSIGETKNPEVLYLLADCYSYGHGAEKNPEEAFKQYKKAAYLGHLLSTRTLGDCYMSGFGTAKNYEMAVEYYTKAKEMGDVRSAMNLGRCHQYGKHFTRSFKNAASVYEEVAENGELDLKFFLAVRFENGDGVPLDYEKAALWYEKAANTVVSDSHPEKEMLNRTKANAMYTLGMYYDEGTCIKQDLDKAIYWYKKAAEQEHSYACFTLAMYSRYGRGVKVSHEQAVEYLKKAEKLGHVGAKFMLGICYLNGEGVEINHDEAIMLLKYAADRGLVDAIYHLALYYLKSDGVSVKHKTAIELLERAAKMEYPPAIIKLADCYEQGLAVEKNLTLALKYRQEYEDAIKDEETRSFVMGGCYESGIGLEQDLGRATELYSSCKKPAPAKKALAACYYYGRGVEQSYEKAAEIYKALVEKELEEKKSQIELPEFTREIFAPKKPLHSKGYYRKKVKNNDTGAMISLGSCYFYGKPVSVNIKESNNKGFIYSKIQKGKAAISKRLDRLKLDADCGDKLSEHILNLLNGQSYKKALKWYTKASELENKEANKYIGYCYDKGFGVEKQKDIAMMHYLNSASIDREELYYTLGVILEREIDPKSPSPSFTAEISYEAAARLKHVESIYRLALYFLGELPVCENENRLRLNFGEKALERLRELDEFNHPFALYRLGMIAEENEDYKAAADFYRRNLKQTNVSAHNNLEICYFSGDRLPLRYPIAIELYQKLQTITK